MPMPFIKESSAAAIAEPVKRKSDAGSEEYDGLEGAMQELHDALMSKNYKSAASIFRSCFDLMESQPHSEGEHE